MDRIPFLSLESGVQEIFSRVIEATSHTISGGRFVLGDALARFERKFADYCGVEHCVGVGNGLDAITLVLRALDIGAGAEVIVPGHTFVATWLGVTLAGATPVPVDIDLTTYNIDPDLVARVITPRTRAILAVHLYGRPAPMKELAKIANKYGLALIEDAAQAHGAEVDGLRAGNLGTAAAFSFYPTKNLGAFGDGGAVSTNDDRIADRLRALRNYGSRIKYQHDFLGVNSRLDELQAALLEIRLEKLSEKNRRRFDIAAQYDELLRNVNGVQRPLLTPGCVWHLYVIRHPQRELLREALDKRGIDTMIHYPVPPHKQAAYCAEYGDLHLPCSTQASYQALSLPLWPEMSSQQVRYVAEAVAEAVSALR